MDERTDGRTDRPTIQTEMKTEDSMEEDTEKEIETEIEAKTTNAINECLSAKGRRHGQGRWKKIKRRRRRIRRTLGGIGPIRKRRSIEWDVDSGTHAKPPVGRPDERHD